MARSTGTGNGSSYFSFNLPVEYGVRVTDIAERTGESVTKTLQTLVKFALDRATTRTFMREVTEVEFAEAPIYSNEALDAFDDEETMDAESMFENVKKLCANNMHRFYTVHGELRCPIQDVWGKLHDKGGYLDIRRDVLEDQLDISRFELTPYLREWAARGWLKPSKDPSKGKTMFSVKKVLAGANAQCVTLKIE